MSAVAMTPCLSATLWAFSTERLATPTRRAPVSRPMAWARKLAIMPAPMMPKPRGAGDMESGLQELTESLNPLSASFEGYDRIGGEASSTNSGGAPDWDKVEPALRAG